MEYPKTSQGLTVASEVQARRSGRTAYRPVYPAHRQEVGEIRNPDLSKPRQYIPR